MPLSQITTEGLIFSAAGDWLSTTYDSSGPRRRPASPWGAVTYDYYWIYFQKKLDFVVKSVIIKGMNSKERMKSWEELSEPRPTWETWKRILNAKKFDLEKAKEQWEKVKAKHEKKKKKTLDSIIVKV